jgi:hypothetical protein
VALEVAIHSAVVVADEWHQTAFLIVTEVEAWFALFAESIGKVLNTPIDDSVNWLEYHVMVKRPNWLHRTRPSRLENVTWVFLITSRFHAVAIHNGVSRRALLTLALAWHQQTIVLILVHANITGFDIAADSVAQIADVFLGVAAQTPGLADVCLKRGGEQGECEQESKFGFIAPFVHFIRLAGWFDRNCGKILVGFLSGYW